MNYIQLMKDLSVADEKEIKENREDLEYIESYLNDHDIKVNDQFILPFVNHIKMMVDRLKNHEPAMGEELGNGEIDEKSYKLASDLLDPLFKKYNVFSKTEITLLSIYFQSIKEEEK